MAPMSNAQVARETRLRERAARQRCFLGCRVVFGPEDFTIEGVARDISPDGARIRIAAPLFLPNRFKVIIAKDTQCFEGELVWRRGQDLGVRWVSPVDLDECADHSVLILRRLAAEMGARP